VGELALQTLALVAYPGALLVLVVGLVGEAAAGIVLDADRGRFVLARLRPNGDVVAIVAAGLLAALAATQLAAPLNPVSPLQRNLLVAAVALASAAWLCSALAGGRSAESKRLALVAQVCWVVALLAPAVLSQTLRPQVLGAVVVPAQLPVKVAAGVLYLLCIPGVLHLLPDLSTGADRLGRALLWLPCCGLFASLFLPPAPDDPLGALRFVAVTLLTAGAAVALAAVVNWRGWSAGVLYLRVAPALAGLVLAGAAVTAALR
jgi:hypothetical protein